ncbi:MAG: hypothetical protein IPH06_06575 [Alphaproteobacteria bacterium]|nr:hypothetical protein [Alphaproteobacteria bacterium]
MGVMRWNLVARNKRIFPLLLACAFLSACAMDQEHYRQAAEEKLKPVLSKGTTEAGIKKYLDGKKIKYNATITKNYCDSPQRYEYYLKLGGTQPCDKILMLFTRQRTFSLFEGVASTRMYLDQDRKLEAISTSVGWKGF